MIISSDRTFWQLTYLPNRVSATAWAYRPAICPTTRIVRQPIWKRRSEISPRGRIRWPLVVFVRPHCFVEHDVSQVFPAGRHLSGAHPEKSTESDTELLWRAVPGTHNEQNDEYSDQRTHEKNQNLRRARYEQCRLTLRLTDAGPAVSDCQRSRDPGARCSRHVRPHPSLTVSV